MSSAKALAASLGVLLCAAGCFPKALSEAEMTDAGIRVRVEQALQAHRELDLSHVTIDVHNHVVTISGVVGSWGDKRLIERVLRDTAGIDQSVVNVVVPE